MLAHGPIEWFPKAPGVGPEPPPDAPPDTERAPDPPHDSRLEPTDETVAELQSLVCRSRQLAPEITAEELLGAIESALRQLMVDPTPGYAVAVAAFALRFREESL